MLLDRAKFISPYLPILTVECLSHQALLKLFNREVSAVRVPNYYEIELGHHLADWIEYHPSRTLYTHDTQDASGNIEYRYYYVDRVGFPRNQLVGKNCEDLEWKLYFAQRDKIINGMRAATGDMHPIDQLISDLNLCWSDGAAFETIDENTLFAGIGRITVAEKDTRLGETPHVDGCWPYEAHFSANVYLRVPDIGGELELWQEPTLTYEELVQLDPNIDWRNAGLQSWSLKPLEGDLIIINTRRPHAVRNFQHGSRVSVSTFVGFDSGQPLKLYS